MFSVFHPDEKKAIKNYSSSIFSKTNNEKMVYYVELRRLEGL